MVVTGLHSPDPGEESTDRALARGQDPGKAMLVPILVWGRDEMKAGEMWNSNSIISWMIARIGLNADSIEPPAGGRAPGWAEPLLTTRPTAYNIQVID
jgi:hypothetical protein